MLTRTGSQLLSATGLPAEITSLAELSAVISALANIAPSQLDISGLNITNASLMPNAIAATTKSFIPLAAKALKAASAQTAEFNKLRHGLQLIFRYISSPGYHAELARSMVEQGVFDELIERKLEERMEEFSGSSGRPSKQRKKRDPLLEEHMHYIVNKMVHRQYSKKGRVVVSELKDWPEPVVGGRQAVEVAPGVTEEVWRPQWDDLPSNTAFINEYLEQMEEEFPDEHAEAELRSSLGVFFASINRGRIDQASGKREEIKLQQNRSSRSTSLHTSMTSMFETSPLNKCRERNFFRQAFNSEGVFITPLAYKDQHHLPKQDSTLADGSVAGFDGFWLFADLFFGTKTLEGSDLFVVRDVEWWSDLLALGFYVLYEHSKTKSTAGQRSRTPLFHVPHPYRLQTTPESLPILPAPPGPGPSTSKKPSGRTKVGPKIAALCRGMVNEGILQDERYAVWCKGLAEDAAVDETAAELPTLSELLDDVSYRVLARAARSHLRVMPELDSEVYRGLWRLRSEGSEEEYRRALVARDLAAYVEAIDWSSVGMYD